MNDGTVVKAFRRESQTSRPVEDWRDHEALTRGFFEAEASAYERLSHHAVLSISAPRFLGRIDPASILDLAQPPERGYVRDCGFRLEQIPGNDIKVSVLAEPLHSEVAAILERLRDEVE